ncbi:caspase family protein [Larkinella rosea]|uniref:Peptidase C14 caspase domain-containing protein n=1 Tax=Larkinella rosea TaxID=2025312 RepID=A0A3P1BIX4_9BACT|nr:caspase family protein [Larkinella rosea]RRB00988.1 hypothetical protein EHT25_22670 [Larkinella rosea]
MTTGSRSQAIGSNPYRSWTRGTGATVFAPVQPAVGTRIMYATEPGKTAYDGNEANGLFTSELVKHISQPNVDRFDLVDRIDQGLEEIQAATLTLKGRYGVNSTSKRNEKPLRPKNVRFLFRRMLAGAVLHWVIGLTPIQAQTFYAILVADTNDPVLADVCQPDLNVMHRQMVQMSAIHYQLTEQRITSNDFGQKNWKRCWNHCIPSLTISFSFTIPVTGTT